MARDTILTTKTTALTSIHHRFTPREYSVPSPDDTFVLTIPQWIVEQSMKRVDVVRFNGDSKWKLLFRCGVSSLKFAIDQTLSYVYQDKATGNTYVHVRPIYGNINDNCMRFVKVKEIEI